ncbi:MAG TPA: myxococcus cysteine-rich repeat containing protein [Minicystis sp.]|nr:myxococcus cysteine-rich repeat containing protein [Minicystis sp.]
MRSRAWWMAPAAAIVVAAAMGQTTAGCGGGDTSTSSGGSGGMGGATSSSSSHATTTSAGGSTGTSTGGSNTGGTTSTGGGGAGPVDACPGEAHSMGIGTQMFSGSTANLHDDIQVTSGACHGGADTSGNDAIYAVTFTADATVTATATGHNGLDVVLIAENDCGMQNSLDFCENQTTTGSEQQTTAVTAGQTVFFIVDGNAGSSGTYTLQIDAAAPACGDGYVNPGEQCDDGNTMDGDGCSSTCQTEQPMDASETCPGDTVPIPLNVPVDIQGAMPAPIGEATTLNYADNYQTCDSLAMPNGGNDRVFELIPAAAGTMTVELRNIGSNGGFDGVLSGWLNTCSPAPAIAFDDVTTFHDPPTGDYLGCSDQAYGDVAYTPGDTNTYENLLPFTVAAGQPVFVVVDGYQDVSAGEFWLHVTLAP